MTETQTAGDVQRLLEDLGRLPEPLARPPFIVVSGLPGTGKSHFCHKLAERIPFLILESDALRRVLFPAPVYSPQESTRLFRAVHELIKRLLDRGIPLILDATNLSERYRERLYHIADQSGARLILVRVEAPAEVVRRRLEKRAEAASPEEHSEADWAVFQKMQPAVQKMRRRHFAVDTSRDISPVIDKIIREINR